MSSYDKAGAVEAGPRGRHMSVSNYEANLTTGNAVDSGRRRSSIVPAGAVGAGTQSNVLNQKDDTLRKMSVAVPNLAELTSDAKAAADAEKNMTFREGFRLYPKAIIFSLILSLAVVMEGYDTWLLGSFFAQPAFQRKYGEPAAIVDGVQTYEVASKWQIGIGNATAATNIVGLLLNGVLSERIGYKYTMLGSLVFISCVIFVTFFAKNVQMLLVGYVLSGLPWGIFQTLTTTYAAEVTPVALRAYLTTYVNLCWVMGQFISSGVLKGVSQYADTDQWAYRLPFALQWMWPVPIAIGCIFAPESPWFLVRNGRIEEAKASLRRLGRNNTGVAIDVDQRIAQIQHTDEVEKVMNEGTSYFDCFRGTNLRRTEIVCMVWMIQTLCGSGFIGYSTEFYIQAGLAKSNAFSLSLGQYALGAVGTISSWWTMNYFGRRTLYLWGLGAMAVVLLGVGGSGFGHNSSASWAAGSLVIVFSFLYQFTVGPVCYCLVAEIPSTRLRAKSVVLARSAYNIVGIINNIIFPRMLSPISWHWGRKAGFFWAGGCALSAVWTFFRLPEPKGRTYAELDVLFDDRVPARKFATTAVDLFAHGKSSSHDEMPSHAGVH